MPNTEVKVTLNGRVTIVFNDYTSGTPEYVIRNTPELLAPPEPRQTKADRQADHGVHDSLSFYNERVLPFSGEIIGTSQSNRKTLEDNLKKCLALKVIQSLDDDDGYILVQITDEDSTLKQCYAKIISKVNFHVLDDIDPSRRSFDFVMMAKDPWLYSQTLQTATGEETYQGTNFQVVESASPTVPFTLYQNTVITATCSNGGTADAPPSITITGPTTGPIITNSTTGEYIDLNGLVLLTGESVTIDVSQRTILKNDGTDLSAYFAAGSTWLVLIPGTNEFTLLDDSPSLIEASCSIQWRNTYV